MNIEDMDRLGRRSPLTCPDCGGVMWEISDGDLTRYRCHVGHACSIELMRLALDEQLRRAIAVVLRSFDERSAVAKRLAADARNTGRSRNADRWQSEAQEFEQQAKSLRESVRRIDDMILSIESHQGPVSVVGPGA